MNINSDNVVIDEEKAGARIQLDKRVYSKSAVLKACYWLDRDLWFQLEEGEEHLSLTVRLRITSPTLAHPKIKTMEEWLPDVFGALLDAELREQVQAETAEIRELIIAKAFAESGVLEDAPPGTFEDPVEARRGTQQGKLIRISES
jgi:His-Xaa-Ser system protein HxsD